MHTGMPLKVWLSVPTLSIVSLKADSVLQVPLFLSVILAHFFSSKLLLKEYDSLCFQKIRDFLTMPDCFII